MKHNLTHPHYTLRKKHPRWLKRLNHRCQWSKAVIGKEVDGQYIGYNFHHTSSNAYDHEWVGVNYLLLSKPAHAFVHRLGGVTMGKGAIRRQNKKAKQMPLPWLWRFPNPLQRLFHAICRLGGVKAVATFWLPLVVAGFFGWLYWPEISEVLGG